MKTTTTLLIAIVFVTSMLGVASTSVANSTLRVPSDYPTIQAAINAAVPGDIVQVSQQTYYENLVINKNVQLVGENCQTTIIDGGEKGTVIDAYADNVYINGFTIQNSGVGEYDFNSGIHVHSCVNIVIIGNNITNNEFGVRLEDARDNVVSDNEITHSVYNAVFLRNATSNHISANIITNNTYGLRLENGSSYNFIRRNTIVNSSMMGISLHGDSDNNIIHENSLEDNEYGVYLSSSFNTIYENTLRTNYHGVSSFLAGEVGNVLYRNNLIDNTKQVFLNYESVVEAWDNGLEGNHWSDYIGEDLNGDGIGDTGTPHQGFDWHPLIDPWSSFRIFNVIKDGENYVVTTLSNSTIASLSFDKSSEQIRFNATGPSHTLGFCNITISKDLLTSVPPKEWSITVDGVNVVFTLSENSTHTFLCFTYAHSTRMVQVRLMQLENCIPIADFTYSPTDPKVFDTIDFTDLSTDSDGSIVSWNWEFGDGDNSEEQNPKHKYSNAGPNVVTLVVEDDLGAKTATFRAIIIRKLGTTLSIDAPSTANRGDMITITATLKDEIEDLISDATIRLYIYEQEEWESIGYNETSTNGIAMISYTPLVQAGTYQLKVTFNGTQTLAESSITFTIEIKDVAWTLLGLPWWIVAVCLISVITVGSVAIYFIWRRRRRIPAS